MEKVVIVGGGIAGLATAVALRRVGIQYLVLERARELRATGAAITLAPNAWVALAALGVAHKLSPLYPRFQKNRITNVDVGVAQEVNLTASEAMELRCVHRKALLEALAEELPHESIRFSSKLASIKTEKDEKSSSLVHALHLDDGTVIRAKVLIGCDGVHSVVSKWLGLKTPVHSGREGVRGLAVLPDGHKFAPGPQQFIRDDKRAGFVPLNNKELYWFLTHRASSKEQEYRREPELIKKEVIESVGENFAGDFVNAVNHSDLSTVTWAPLMLRLPWDVFFGRMHSGTVTVAGDALHPMPPDLGQGGCCALEDAVVLARNMASSPENLAKGIEMYVRERRWRATSLIAGSFVSGWVQQGGSGPFGWVLRLVRDSIFYKFTFSKLFRVVDYDCGVLPSVKD